MLWTPAEIAELTGRRPSPAPAQRFAAITATIDDPLAALLWYNLSTYLPDDLLVKADRMSMAHGLEVRSPFLDTALLEWALRLPRRLQWRGRRGKWLLRQAYRDVLPAEILNRPKHGFGVPLDSWFRGPLRPLLHDTLLAANAELAGWISRPAIAQLCHAHWNKSRNAGHQLWALLTLELWLRQQKMAPAPSWEATS
jgi:asparagine synthase (glutamine-hydrolysing)